MPLMPALHAEPAGLRQRPGAQLRASWRAERAALDQQCAAAQEVLAHAEAALAAARHPIATGNRHGTR